MNKNDDATTKTRKVLPQPNEQVVRNPHEVSLFAQITDRPELRPGLTFAQAQSRQDHVLSQLAQDDVHAKLNTASALMLSGEFDLSIQVFHAIARDHHEQRWTCLNSIGACYYFLGQYTRAIEHYELAAAAGAPADIIQENIDEAREALASN